MQASFQACSEAVAAKMDPAAVFQWLDRLLVLLALGLYAFAGVYQVDQQERGVVFRFGKVLPNEVGQGCTGIHR